MEYPIREICKMPQFRGYTKEDILKFVVQKPKAAEAAEAEADEAPPKKKAKKRTAAKE